MIHCEKCGHALVIDSLEPTEHIWIDLSPMHQSKRLRQFRILSTCPWSTERAQTYQAKVGFMPEGYGHYSFSCQQLELARAITLSQVPSGRLLFEITWLCGDSAD